MLTVGGRMKFLLLLGGVVLAAGGVAFIATGQPAAPNPLAGDWRCNVKTGGYESAVLMSIANDGGVRGQAFINQQVKGRRVILHLPYTSHLRLQGGQLFEDTTSFDIDHGSIDGGPVPEIVKSTVRAGMTQASARYTVQEISPSRLVYTYQGDRTLCEKSNAPLNL